MKLDCLKKLISKQTVKFLIRHLENCKHETLLCCNMNVHNFLRLSFSSTSLVFGSNFRGAATTWLLDVLTEDFFVVVVATTEETICVEANEGSEEEHVEIFLACELLEDFLPRCNHIVCKNDAKNRPIYMLAHILEGNFA